MMKKIVEIVSKKTGTATHEGDAANQSTSSSQTTGMKAMTKQKVERDITQCPSQARLLKETRLLTKQSLPSWLVIVGKLGGIETSASLGWWNPLGRLPWKGTLHPHGVHILKGQTLGLWDEEEHVEEGEHQTAHEHETVGEVDGTGDEWGEERDQETPDPVATLGNGHTLGLDSQWVGLGVHHIWNRSPRRGEAEDEEAGEDNHTVTGTLGRTVVLTVRP